MKLKRKDIEITLGRDENDCRCYGINIEKPMNKEQIEQLIDKILKEKK